MAITDQTPRMRELVPELLGGRSPQHDPARPHATRFRRALLRSGGTTTFTVNGDWVDDADRWLNTTDVTYAPSTGNSAEYYVDGDEAYAAFCEAAATATGPQHFILILGWTCHHSFTLSHAPRARPLAGHTLFNILEAKASAGVEVRLLLYHQFVRELLRNVRPDLGPSPGVQEVLRRHVQADASAVELTRDAINDLGLPNAKCELDQGNRARGCHHNKVWIVNGSEGLVAFYGGVDFNPDRVSSTSDGRPMHDVHARVRGRAANDVLEMAIQRWNNADIAYRTAFREWLAGQANRPPIRGRDIEDWSRFRLPPSEHAAGTAHVAPCQSVGNPAIQAMRGQHSDIWPAIRRAIQGARRFIYIEDQYFWSLEAARELASVLHRIAHLTILIPGEDVAEAHNIQRAALAVLWDAAETPENRRKIGVYERVGRNHSYIHAKMFVFDDEYAIVGSANMNRRGYGYDGETSVGVVDRAPTAHVQRVASLAPWSASVGATLAHKLRMRLWAHHLGGPAERMGGRLWDGVASATLWRKANLADLPPPAIPGVLQNPPRWLVTERGNVREHMIQNYPWWAWVVERGPTRRRFDDRVIDPGLSAELDAGESGSRRYGD